MENNERRDQQVSERGNQDIELAKILGITVEEYRYIGCYPEKDLDGSMKVFWSANADTGIVAKIRGKQSVDDEHVTISQDMSQLGDPY